MSIPQSLSPGEEELALHLRAEGIAYEREVVFAAPRKYRFDFFLPGLNLAIECDGGTWTGGRHSFGKGYESDCNKLNLATSLGFRVLRFTTAMIRRGEAINTILQWRDKE